MSGNYPAGVTDNHPEFDIPDRDDQTDAPRYASLEPIETAPKDREITVVIGDTWKKQRAFWQDDLFSSGCWMDANGDGAIDGVWRHWDNDELIGWLP